MPSMETLMMTKGWRLTSGLLAMSLLVAVPGCVVDDGDDDEEFESGGPEGRTFDEDRTTAECVIADDYASAPEQDTAYAGETDDGDQYLFVETTVEANGNTHLVAVDLWNDYGVFEGGWETGRYEITGDETDYDECGACVYVLEDYDPDDGTYGRLLMADGGWVNVDTLDATPGSGYLSGYIEDVTFREVTEDEDGYYEVEEGCTTGLESFEYDAGVAPESDYEY